MVYFLVVYSGSNGLSFRIPQKAMLYKQSQLEETFPLSHEKFQKTSALDVIVNTFYIIVLFHFCRADRPCMWGQITMWKLYVYIGKYQISMWASTEYVYNTFRFLGNIKFLNITHPSQSFHWPEVSVPIHFYHLPKYFNISFFWNILDYGQSDVIKYFTLWNAL